MLDFIAPLLDSILNPIKEAVARMARSAAELAMVGLFGLLCVGFLMAALVIWLTNLVGGIYATLIMAGIFLVLAVIVLAIWMSSNAADRKKAEAAAREKEEQRRRKALGSPSMWRTAMNLAPLVSLVAKRTRRSRRSARALAERKADRTEALSDRVAEDARRAALMAADTARSATQASRRALRGSMAGVGPWAIVAVAVAGGALASRIMRRR
jgi:ABC-type multidrug transport system fused ATPase/permease subunit